ncbi:MAG: ABC transporter substrate-binding protein [Solirubrobacterales bacterium]|nr:ABC transporter substrate-binding protein [Solirubrobacterales bacterium]
MGKRTSAIRLGVLHTLGIALLVSALSACGSTSGSGSTTIKKTLRVALIGPQSGQLASLGDWDYKGVTLAANQINAAGGAAGLKIQVTRMDDQGDPTTGGDLARKAVSDHYDVIFGSSSSTITLAMLPIATAAKIPEVTSGQADALTKRGSAYIFLDSPTSTTYDATLATYAIGTLGKKRIAMITNNGAYGKGEHDAFLKQLKLHGLQPVADSVITPDQKDMSGPLSSIRSAHPDALFIGAEEVESGLIAKQARSLGITATIIEGAPAGTPQYLQTAGPQAAEGTVVSSPYLSNDLNAQTRAFAAAYEKAYGQTPELHGAKAYDGMEVIATAVESLKGKITPQAIAQAMHSVTYNGLLGTIHYNSSGVGLFQTRIGVIKNGQIVQVQAAS